MRRLEIGPCRVRQGHRRAGGVALVFVLWAMAPLVAMSSDQAVPTGPAAMTSLRAKVDVALRDAAGRTGLDAARLHVTLAEPVTWPDGSLGCPEPGREYTQVLVNGYRIRILAGGVTLEYHASLRGEPFLCPAARIREPTLVDPRR